MPTYTAPRALWLALAASLALSACTPHSDSYPVSGAPCGPDDPVQDLDARDCLPLPAGTV
jgi:hypothetical protein